VVDLRMIMHRKGGGKCGVPVDENAEERGDRLCTLE
jgi:hypothetical protein